MFEWAGLQLDELLGDTSHVVVDGGPTYHSEYRLYWPLLLWP